MIAHSPLFSSHFAPLQMTTMFLLLATISTFSSAFQMFSHNNNNASHQNNDVADFDHKPLMGLEQVDTDALDMWGTDVMHLDGANFKQTVLNSAANKHTDFLVIFYSHTCPHCRMVAQTLRNFARSVADQRNRVVIAVYNVKRPFNAAYARQIKSYPTVIYFKQSASEFKNGRKIEGFADMPLEQMKVKFDEVLAGSFDLSDMDDELLELDASSYWSTKNGVLWKQQKSLLVTFFNGSAPKEWKKLANLAHNWKSVVRVAFVNCALPANWQEPCRNVLGDDVRHLPMADLVVLGKVNGSENHEEIMGNQKHEDIYKPLDYTNNMASMRSQLAAKLLHENINQIMWMTNQQLPFAKTNPNDRASILIQPWRHIEHFLQVYMLLVFEHPTSNNTNSGVDFSSKLILSLLHWKRFIHVVPISSQHWVTRKLFPKSNPALFPRILLFRTDNKTKPLLNKSYGSKNSNINDLIAAKDIVAATNLLEDDTKVYYDMTQLIPQQIPCEKLFSRCRALYFASETDMLKALREAIFDEVVTKVDVIRGRQRVHLLQFLTVLQRYLPGQTKISHKVWKNLPRTRKAKMVFGELKNLLANNQELTAEKWEAALITIENTHGRPFPLKNVDWQHCKGINLQNSRRFTCGMWTAFHVLTVNAYKKFKNGRVNDAPQRTLKAIQGWVDSFFGCEDCRKHFMEMTTRAMPIEREVKSHEQMVLYLWRAHNRVNDRLEQEESFLQEKIYQRDLIFKKRQFPPKFVCPWCAHENETQMLHFLVGYYDRIEPIGSKRERWERDLAYKGAWWQLEYY